MTLKEAKRALRKTIRERSATMDKETMVLGSQRIQKTLEESREFQEAEAVLLYHALPGEVQTEDLIWKWAKKKRILLPRVKGEDLEIIQVTSPEDLEAGTFGVMEPRGSALEDLSCIDLVIVPGQAFDRCNHRMGHGRGFYDRLLTQLPHTRKIGIAFSWQIVESIPVEPHDISMDRVITDEVHS